MSYVETCDKHGQYHADYICGDCVEDLTKERDELRTLLEETLDWLCPHIEAAQQKKTNPDIRAWCCDCHNYLRAASDATLIERIEALLKK